MFRGQFPGGMQQIFTKESAVEYFNILWPEFYELRLKFTHYKNLDLFLFVL